MLVEPPGSHVPAGLGLIPLGALRLGVAAAALVLAVLSRGDSLALAAALALAAWRPLPALALGAALVASSWRWGSTSLEALAGNQAVLGAAGWVGPAWAAVGSWLAATAVVLAATRAPRRADQTKRAGGAIRGLRARDVGADRAATEVGGIGGSQGPSRGPNVVPGRAAPEVGGTEGSQRPSGAPNLEALASLVLALAAGATAAAVVAGPAPGGDVWMRVVAGLLAAALAIALSLLRGRSRALGSVLDGIAVAAGVAAVVAVAADAPGWTGTVDGDALREGVAVAAATAVLVTAGATAVRATRERRG